MIEIYIYSKIYHFGRKVTKYLESMNDSKAISIDKLTIVSILKESNN